MFLLLDTNSPTVPEDRHIQIGIAMIAGGIITVISQPFLHFDWYWSTAANVVVFVLSTLAVHYAIESVTS